MADYENEKMFFLSNDNNHFQYLKDIKEIKKIESIVSKKLDGIDYLKCMTIVLKNSIYSEKNDNQFYYLMDKFAEHTVTFAKTLDNKDDNDSEEYREIKGSGFTQIMLREKEEKERVRKKELRAKYNMGPYDRNCEHPILHEIAHQLPRTFNKLKYCVNHDYFKNLLETNVEEILISRDLLLEKNGEEKVDSSVDTLCCELVGNLVCQR